VTEPPPRDGLKRLLAESRPETSPHPIEPWTLGEYAVLLVRGGEAAAAAFPEVAAHLATGCATCADHLAELRAAINHEAEVRRALGRETDAHRYIEETGADEPLAADLERYYHNRWDPDILADVNALHGELERRLKDLQDGQA
jgi:hypothetical protein